MPVGSAVENELLTDMLRDEGEPLTNGQEQRTITTTNFFRPPEDRSKSGFALVFEDNGACITVNQVEVYLKVCPRVDEKFASYPKSVAPGMGFEKVEGLCVANAASSGPPRKMCTPSGKWDDEYKSSSCHCNPGYAPGLGSSSNQCTGIVLNSLPWDLVDYLPPPPFCKGGEDSLPSKKIVYAYLINSFFNSR